ncbi:MAG: hypothetical protein ACO2ZM_05610 [Francisellaceae bacterium]
MAKKISLNDTFRQAYGCYQKNFRSVFLCAMLLSALSQYVIIYADRLGLRTLFQSLSSENGMTEPVVGIDKLGWLVMLLFVLNFMIYALIIAIYDKDRTAEANPYSHAFGLLRRRFWSFFVVYVLNGILVSLFGFVFWIVGIWLALSLTLVVFPNVILGNKGVKEAYIDDFLKLKQHVFYMLQIGFIVILLLFVGKFLHFLMESAGFNGQIGFGVEHVVLIFVEAVVLPFILALNVTAYYLMNEMS